MRESHAKCVSLDSPANNLTSLENWVDYVQVTLPQESAALIQDAEPNVRPGKIGHNVVYVIT